MCRWSSRRWVNEWSARETQTDRRSIDMGARRTHIVRGIHHHTTPHRTNQPAYHFVTVAQNGLDHVSIVFQGWVTFHWHCCCWVRGGRNWVVGMEEG